MTERNEMFARYMLGTTTARSSILYSPRREVTQSGVMTLRKVVALIRAGYGQGHRQHYKPWLRVEKRDMSPCSVMGHLPSPEFGHTHHYQSRLERETLLMLKWAEPYDVRDQFPVWLWPHRHPGYGLPGFENAPDLAGLQALADASEIRLRSSPTRVIPTLDALSTWVGRDGKFSLTAQQCRPRELMQNPDAGAYLERMELLRRYCLEAGIPHQVIHTFENKGELALNLDALRPREGRPVHDNIRSSRAYHVLLESCLRLAYEHPLQVALDRASRRAKLEMQQVHRLLAIALWYQDVDHDLRLPREPWMPLRTGGRTLKATLAKRFSEGAV